MSTAGAARDGEPHPIGGIASCRARTGKESEVGSGPVGRIGGTGMAERCERGISVTVLEENDRPLEFRHAIWLREAGACLILRRQWVGTGPEIGAV